MSETDAAFARLRREADDFEKRAKTAEAQIRVVSEPLTYRRDLKDVSYFQDRAIAMQNPESSAQKRLQRHAKEMEVLESERISRKPPEGLEYRVSPSRQDGYGGYFSPPAWLIQDAIMAPRVGRILSDLVPSYPLPQGVSEVILPAITSGVAAEPDIDNTPVEDADDLDARISSPVVSFAGMQDCSLQLLEQSPQGAHFDAFVAMELDQAYNADLEAQMINGKGSTIGGPYDEFLGLLSVPGIIEVTTTETNVVKQYKAFGEAVAKIGKERKAPPEACLMTTSRWAYTATGEDSANRPMSLNDYQGMFPIGSLIGWPVYLDDALPQTLGATKTEECILFIRPRDLMLLESEPKVSVYLEPLSGILGARIVMNRYAAFLVRYSKGIAVVRGSGLNTQTGY